MRKLTRAQFSILMKIAHGFPVPYSPDWSKVFELQLVSWHPDREEDLLTAKGRKVLRYPAQYVEENEDG
jgi:hypothetical protein